MRLLPKQYFYWNEPAEFRPVLDEHERRHPLIRWQQPLVTAGFCGVLLMMWGLAHISPARQPLPFHIALPLVLVGGWLLGYVLPWFCRKIPARIGIAERTVTRVWGANQIYRIVDLTGFSWREQASAGYSILVLHHRRWGEVWVGVPPDVSREALEEFFTERIGKKQPWWFG